MSASEQETGQQLKHVEGEADISSHQLLESGASASGKDAVLDVQIIDDTTPSLKDKPEDCQQYSWFAALCCCFLIGIPAVRYSKQAREAYRQGDIEGAQKASISAKRWTAVAIVIGMLIWYTFMFYIIFSNFKFKDDEKEE
ncbi:proline rich transmembrane protein 1B-like isoform X2 [Glandiceps talaboti]